MLRTRNRRRFYWDRLKPLEPRLAMTGFSAIVEGLEGLTVSSTISVKDSVPRATATPTTPPRSRRPWIPSPPAAGRCSSPPATTASAVRS